MKALWIVPAAVLAVLGFPPGPGKLEARLRPLTVSCLVYGARQLEVPQGLILLVLAAEGGQVGQVSHNPGGSYDLGPMQINSWWLPLLKQGGITAEEIRDNGCTNVLVGTWILKLQLRQAKNVWQALAWYHSRQPRLGEAYVRGVLKTAKSFDLRKVLGRANRKVPVQ
ncbi:MAG: lytic transglycosylase domain-containing protein [Deltaproteobacteria bacterium]|jgi:soluble lytic murein transglycosylase-like protein|nr:lytic transglycosylase domain-containing protein [Deltaproteobacteria bacterium]